MFFILMFSQIVNASWCDIKKIPSGEIHHTYAGVCDQRKFGGPWGSSKLFQHVVNTTKDASDAAKRADEEAKLSARRSVMDRLKAANIDNATPAQVKLIVKDLFLYLKSLEQ